MKGRNVEKYAAVEKGDRLIYCRFQDRTLYRYETVRANFVWGRNDFCLGMNLDEFGQVLGPRRPGVRDKGHILPHSDSTPQPLLRLITQFVLVKCNLARKMKT